MTSNTPPKGRDRAAIRQERREAAIAKAKRNQRIKILAWIGAGAVALAALLIYMNLPEDTDDAEIVFSAIPQNGTTLGDLDAPVTLVEYADYQCPACGEFATESFPNVVEDFVRTGKVKFEFNVFPFLGGSDLASPANESVNAAMAAECARDQGKFWEYSHQLFVSQDGENSGGFSDEKLAGFADDLGLDQDAFVSCYESGEKRQTVIDSYDAAQEAGVNSTPTLFINGVQVAYTNQGYDKLKEQLDAAVAGEAIP